MNWVDVASNQCFSGNTLQNAVANGYFVLKNSIPANSKMVTKDEAYNYVYINPIPSKTSNQLVVKSNLVAASALPYSYTLYFNFNDNNAYVGFTTSGGACSATNAVTVYSSSSSIGIGTALYSDLYGTEGLIASTDGTGCSGANYFRIGTSYITFQPIYALQCDGYIIDSIGTCSVSYTISWSLTDVTTGTANMEIFKNGSAIVIQSGNGSGSFSVTSSDVVYYTLLGTSPNFTYVQISDSVNGTISDCNFNSAFVNSFPGYSYTSNASIDGVAIDYVDSCP